VAAYRLPGGVAATVGSLQPLVVTGMSAAWLGERVSLRTVGAAATGVFGVGLLVLRANAQLDALGIAAELGVTLVMGTGVVLAKRWTSPAPLLATTGWQLIAGGLLLLPVALLVEGFPPAALSVRNVAGYAYLSTVGAALAYALWFRGIRALSPTQVTFLVLLNPTVATGVGWLALGQTLTPTQVLGGIIVFASLVAAQRSSMAPRSNSGQRKRDEVVARRLVEEDASPRRDQHELLSAR